MYFDPMTGPHFPVSSSASLFLAGIWAFVKTATSPSLSELASYWERLSPTSLARSWEPPNLLWGRVFSPPVTAQSGKLLLHLASICGAAGSLTTSSWTPLVLSGPRGANHANQVREIDLWGASLGHVTGEVWAWRSLRVLLMGTCGCGSYSWLCAGPGDCNFLTGLWSHKSFSGPFIVKAVCLRLHRSGVPFAPSCWLRSSWLPGHPLAADFWRGDSCVGLSP